MSTFTAGQAARYAHTLPGEEAPARIIETGFNGSNVIAAVKVGDFENLAVFTEDGRLVTGGPIRLTPA